MQMVTGSGFAQIHVAKEPVLNDEFVCYFVTFSYEKSLKPHVEHHIKSLVECGVAVVLIVNFVDDNLSAFKISDQILSILAGAIVRENLGFDFAAWSHAYKLYKPSASLKRAFFINDSIVGPLGNGYSQMLDEFKSSEVSLIGLTDNPFPKDHVQSFFWSLSNDAFFNKNVARYIEGMVNFSDKQFVIDVYEVGLTERLAEFGFNWSSIFQNTAKTKDTNQTIYEWESLLERGFPFVKASLFSEQESLERLARYVPVELRPDANEPRHLR